MAFGCCHVSLKFSDARLADIHRFPLRHPEWRMTFLGSATHVGGAQAGMTRPRLTPQ